MLRIVNLHGWARWIASTTTDAFLFINFQGWLTIDLCRSNCSNWATGHNRRPLTNICHQIVVNLWRLGVLNVDRNIALTTAIDLTAGRRDMNPVGHVAVSELINQFIHHRLHDSRCVSTGNITVQPALGMRNHRH